MGLIEIVVVILAVLIVVGVIASIVIAKKRGKPSLLDDCACCPHAKECGGKCCEHYHKTNLSENESANLQENTSDQ